MTEYKPRTTTNEKRWQDVACCANSGDSYHCDDILYDLAHAESCLKERDAEIERIKNAAYEKLSISDVMALGL